MGYLLCFQQNDGPKLSVEDSLVPIIPRGLDGCTKCRNPKPGSKRSGIVGVWPPKPTSQM